MDDQKTKTASVIPKYVDILPIFDFEFGDNRVTKLIKLQWEIEKTQQGVIWCSWRAMTIMTLENA